MNRKQILGTLLVLGFLSFADLPKLVATPSNQLLITEIGNHESSDYEWIEIYNPNSTEINLTGLIFKEESVNHKTTLMQGSNILPSETYALIVNKYDKFIEKYPEFLNSENIILDSSWTNLNNNGELLELILDNQILESITYTTNSGNTSLERIFNQQNYESNWHPHPTNHSIFKSSSKKTELEKPEEIEDNENSEENSENSNQDEENENETDGTSENNENPNQETETQEPEESEETESPEPELENSTPTIIYKNQPFLIISEVSFNSSPDWIEIFIDPRQETIEPNKLQLEIDKKFINIEHLEISEPTIITVDLNLVATTEQVSLIYNNQVYDSICWTNQSPPESEIIEEQLLKSNNYWQGNCLNSSLLKTNYSFNRTQLLPDTNSDLDFQANPNSNKGEIKTYSNKAPIANIQIKAGKTTNTIPFQITLDGSKSEDPEEETLSYNWKINNSIISTKATPDPFKFETKSEQLITLTVTDENQNSSSSSLLIIANEAPKQSSSTNGSQTISETNNSTKDESKNIQISKFLANPKGSDTDLEFIEIINLDTQTVSLKNYYIDDEEGGSKPHHLEKYSLKSNEKLLVSIAESKLTLGNTKDSVRLLHYDKVLEEVSYENAKDDEVFEKINNQWQRKTNDTSKNEISSNSTEESLSTSSTKIEVPASLNSQTLIKGDLNNQITINEVFPNPKGTDKGQEWIELYNASEKTTNLNGWQLKFNTKSFSLEEISIKANQHYLLKKDSLSIPNSNLTIQLIDFNQKIIDEFKFESSKENQSIFRIQSKYFWSNSPTPGEKNPELIELEGTITKVNLENQQFTLETKQQETFQITYDNSFQTKLQEQTQIKISAWQNSNSLTLNEILNLTTKSESSSKSKNNPLWTLTLPLLGIPGYIFRTKLKEVFEFLSNQK